MGRRKSSFLTDALLFFERCVPRLIELNLDTGCCNPSTFGRKVVEIVVYNLTVSMLRPDVHAGRVDWTPRRDQAHLDGWPLKSHREVRADARAARLTRLLI